VKLRSVELEVTKAAEAQKFLTEVWGLADAGRRGNMIYLRATADQPYVVALTEAASSALGSVTFSGTEDEVKKLHSRAQAAGARCGETTQFDEPGAGLGFIMEGREGQIYRFLTEKERTAALATERDRPLQLTHVVLNVKDREAATRYAQDVFGFKLSDRTRAMSFLRCDSTHHSVAYVDSDVSSLNHLAFEMPTLDGVMRGIGRLKDHGIEAVWGPGRHGPGNNVFGYFIAPFGACIEYTSEVQRVDDSYKTGNPEDWTWPPGRGDQWGVSGPDRERMHQAERAFRFKARATA
jgi:2,3-dihydroxy-p-cumate/2,3-dihydroxybenzoate 3,4-dioxygenase